MRQNDRIIQLLRLRGDVGLTPGEALTLVGTMRLAARILEIRELMLRADEEIVNVGADTPSGKHVARYVLQKRREPAGQVSLWSRM